MSNPTLSWIGPLSLGAMFMYLFDPIGGRRRRAMLRDQAVHLTRLTGDASSTLARDVRNRATGLRAQLQRREDDDLFDDAVIEARIRSAIGRVSTHPGAIGVASVDGIVTIVGPVLAHEHGTILRAARRARGVVDVIDHTTQHEYGDSVPGLQGEGTVPGGWLLGNWSPTTRMLAIVGGAGLIAYGLQQRNVIGGVAASFGAGLVSRGLANVDVRGRLGELLDRTPTTHEAPAFDVLAGERGLLGTTGV
jgi:hypothetical protein